MLPESNQQSMTSGTRPMAPPHFSQFSLTSSIYGLCKSRSSGTALLLAFSSSMLPTHSWWPHSRQIQIGSGVPQNRSRESAQSMLFSSHSPNRPSPTSFGYQLIFLLFSINRSLKAVVRMYQDFLA